MIKCCVKTECSNKMYRFNDVMALSLVCLCAHIFDWTKSWPVINHTAASEQDIYDMRSNSKPEYSNPWAVKIIN